jgi:DNA invertase Pin-like site-specific DNA recombinase
MKTVLYCRVSTADQTLEHQLTQAEATGFRFLQAIEKCRGLYRIDDSTLCLWGNRLVRPNLEVR